MNTWKVIFATLVIFGAGVITGAMVVSRFNPPPIVAPAPPVHVQQQQQQEKQQQQQQTDLLHRMDRDLQLTAEQHRKLERVLKESQKRSKYIRDQVSPQLKDEFERVRHDVLAELTPEQQKKFEVLPHTGTLNVFNARKQDKPEEERKKGKKKQMLINSNSTPGSSNLQKTDTNNPSSNSTEPPADSPSPKAPPSNDQ